MYEIERANGRVIVRKGEKLKLNAPEDSYVIHKPGPQLTTVTKLKDLNDAQLLLALASSVDIPNLD